MPATYRSYRDLPPLAGLTTLEVAAKPGLSIEECVARLKRFHYVLLRLHEILTARITAEPIYELKCAFSHHAYLCAEHVQALRNRVAEMREPPLGLEDIPHPSLAIVLDEILAAPTTLELLTGVYAVLLPALDAAMTVYRRDTNPLCDAPSIRVCRFAQLEIADMLAYGTKALECLRDESTTIQSWIDLLHRLLTASGGIDGTGPSGGCNERLHSARPYTYDPVPRRDERFQDLWNQGVNPEAFLYDPSFEPRPKALMMLFKRLREIDVPEMMASIIVQTRGKPWEYYRDMARQLWDDGCPQKTRVLAAVRVRSGVTAFPSPHGSGNPPRTSANATRAGGPAVGGEPTEPRPTRFYSPPTNGIQRPFGTLAGGPFACAFAVHRRGGRRGPTEAEKRKVFAIFLLTGASGGVACKSPVLLLNWSHRREQTMPEKPAERGGLGEPYCSRDCYNQTGRKLALEPTFSDKCEFCKGKVTVGNMVKPVGGGMFVPSASFADSNGSWLPYKNRKVVFCDDCNSKMKKYCSSISECVCCGTELDVPRKVAAAKGAGCFSVILLFVLLPAIAIGLWMR